MMAAVRANGQAAAADYRRGADGVYHAHTMHVLTEDEAGAIAAITVFLDPELFAAVGLPATR
ncbi:MAG: polymerase sigma-70 factor, subfamily [Mycobacterium sp.]|jgi:RNA polymerase sigma-70 factor (ECF subfamily)|nr:polymerase sigma-70 factor, subfamily [Mycobacterium sp.]MDT5327868.1 polymerase sigma-70 factor, subfamily [Mycobacterium sp.]